VAGLPAIEEFFENWLDFDRLRPAVEHVWWLFKTDRKEAMVVNREFLDWLSRRRRPERPFFAFLNYFDAHNPYQLPEKGLRRFGVAPGNTRDASLLRDWSMLIQKGPSAHQVNFARDSYDDCVADLDEQLGRLIDELARRSVLERTWVIITADHGESFGEQPGVFGHGTSLYQPQIHVPLVFIPPAGGPSPRVVTETVSPRALAATIVAVLGFQAGSPFRGEPLGRFWSVSSPTASALAAASDPVLSQVVPNLSPSGDSLQRPNELGWPLGALIDGDWTYIRREGDVREELFHLPEDAHERHNLAREPAMQPTLERMRGDLGRLTGGPLTPERFKP
jgi:arylsulfatase A-like enzyme